LLHRYCSRASSTPDKATGSHPVQPVLWRPVGVVYYSRSSHLPKSIISNIAEHVNTSGINKIIATFSLTYTRHSIFTNITCFLEKTPEQSKLHLQKIIRTKQQEMLRNLSQLPEHHPIDVRDHKIPELLR
jgi:hypothetical protein